jgi:hypothetical protein
VDAKLDPEAERGGEIPRALPVSDRQKKEADPEGRPKSLTRRRLARERLGLRAKIPARIGITQAKSRGFRRLSAGVAHSRACPGSEQLLSPFWPCRIPSPSTWRNGRGS